MIATFEDIARTAVASSGLPEIPPRVTPDDDYSFFARFGDSSDHGILLTVERSGYASVIPATGEASNPRRRALLVSVEALAARISNTVDEILLSRPVDGKLYD